MERSLAGLTRRRLHPNRPSKDTIPTRSRPIAVLVGRHGAVGIHALLGAVKLFRQRPERVLLLSVGEVDAKCYGGPEALKNLKRQTGERCGVIDA